MELNRGTCAASSKARGLRWRNSLVSSRSPSAVHWVSIYTNRTFDPYFFVQSPPELPPKEKTLRISNFHRCPHGSYPRSRQFESVHRHQTFFLEIHSYRAFRQLSHFFSNLARCDISGPFAVIESPPKILNSISHPLFHSFHVLLRSGKVYVRIKQHSDVGIIGLGCNLNAKIIPQVFGAR